MTFPEAEVPLVVPEPGVARSLKLIKFHAAFAILLSLVIIGLLVSLFLDGPSDLGGLWNISVILFVTCFTSTVTTLIPLYLYKNGHLERSKSYKKAILFMYLAPVLFFLSAFILGSYMFACALGGGCSGSGVELIPIFVIPFIPPLLTVIFTLICLRGLRGIFWKSLTLIALLIGASILFVSVGIKSKALLSYANPNEYQIQQKEADLNKDDPYGCINLHDGMAMLSCYEKFGLTQEICTRMSTLYPTDGHSSVAQCFSKIGNCSQAIKYDEAVGAACYSVPAKETKNPLLCEDLIHEMDAMKGNSLRWGLQCYVDLADATGNFDYCEKAYEIAGLNGSSAYRVAGACQPLIGGMPVYQKIQDEPVIWFKFDEGKGESTEDSARVNTGSLLVGYPTWRSGSDCVFGSCLEFNGKDQFVLMPMPLFEKYSFSFWIKPLSNQSGEAQIFNTEHDEVGLVIAADKTLVFSDQGDVRSRTVVEPDRFYHVVISNDGITKRIFVNGVLENSDGGAGGTRIVFGKANFAVKTTERQKYITGLQTNYFNGVLDDIRMYNRGLSAEEVSRIYAENKK